MKEKILFVTKGGDNFEEGFSYAIDLAKTMKAEVCVLMVLERQMSNIFEDLMTAAVFAEAGERKMAGEILVEHDRMVQEEAEKRFLSLSDNNGQAQEYSGLEIAKGDVSAAVTSFLKRRTDIDMVLLSPGLAENKCVFNVKNLLKHIAKPVVTISRPIRAEA